MVARNVLLRTHGFSPYQHVFGRDPELAFDVLVPGADVAAVTMPVIDRPSARATQIRQAAQQAFVECQDDKAMPWQQDRVRGESFQIGDQVAFWRKGKGRGMKHGHARWHGRAVILALCPGSKNVWVAYRHQLLKVSQEQLRVVAITERVADDVIHQELRAFGENSGHFERSTTTVSRRVHSQVRKREQNDTNDSKVVDRDMFNKKALHNLTIQILLMELRQMRKNQKWRRARQHDEELQERELLRMMCPCRRRKNALSVLI